MLVTITVVMIASKVELVPMDRPERQRRMTLLISTQKVYASRNNALVAHLLRTAELPDGQERIERLAYYNEERKRLNAEKETFERIRRSVDEKSYVRIK